MSFHCKGKKTQLFTYCLHFVDLLLIFDDGAVQLFLLRPELKLQLPVLLLLSPHVCVVTTAAASATHFLPVHDLCQLIDGLRMGIRFNLNLRKMMGEKCKFCP